VRSSQELLAFNRGRISRHGLARVDLKRAALSADVQTNWVPRVLGSMMLRPGWQYINTQSGLTKPIPFVFSSSDTAKINVHDGATSFTVDDVQLTRPAVTAAVTNASFTSNITGWTIVDAGTVNAWQTGGYAGLTGDGTAVASIQQQVTVNEANVEHALRIVVQRGPLSVMVGSTSGGGEYIAQTELGTGAHSLAFTPTGASFYVKFFNQNDRLALLDSCTVESSGVVSLMSPWAEADFQSIRYDQSGDIVFVACAGKQQYRIMRRAARSWSIEKYLSDDGPFRLINTGTTTLTPSALSGNVTLTSSAVAGVGVFKSTHVGALFSITSVGQTVSDTFTSQNDFSNHIRVTGVTESRTFSIVVGGGFTANVTLQRSIDEGSSWSDVATYTAVTSTSLADGLDNQIVWYRIGVKTGDYTSGTVLVSLIYNAGSITGVARVTGYTNSTTVSAEVLTDFGGLTTSTAWQEGAWSDYRGWPSAVRFHDGRLFWAGKNKFWGSVTDQFYTFDETFEGDAGPISRSIGYGPVDTVNWMLSLNRLMAGTDGAEVSCRSSSTNEPLTPTNFTPKNSSTQGSANVDAVMIDNKALFIQRNGRRLYAMSYAGEQDDYMPEDLMQMVPEIGDPGVTSMAVQRKPDTRVHCVRSDGTVGLLIFDRLENVACWVDIETSGEVVDVCILPGGAEDAVYYEVRRTIGGSDVYYTEKWALESECRGAAVNKIADSFVYAAAASNTITGLSHLNGQSVVAWGGGADLGTFTVSGGSITLHASTSYTNRCAGLAYAATFKSSKMAYGLQGRTALTRTKKIESLGLIMADTHPQGLEFGPSFDFMDPMPETEAHLAVDADDAWAEYDEQSFEFPGEWDTDARLCLRATAPRACTVLAAVVEIETR
jgi:hypothetical protein